MRPIFWGLLVCVIGLIGWVISVVLTVVTLGSMRMLANIFGVLFIASVPVAAVFELIRWIRQKNK